LQQPFLLMIAGPNGSGKTTLIRKLRERAIDFGEYINPDDIANEIEGTYEARVAQAQIIADRRREACIENRSSFSFETVMSHPSKVDILVRAKEAGFFVQLFFVGTDNPQTNIERVALRVAQGGHDVPREKIISRWARTMEYLSEAIRSADQAFVFDNSIAGFVAAGPRLVFRRSFIQKRNLPRSEQFPPIPDWVRRFVIEPLGIGSLSVYSNLGRPQTLQLSDAPAEGLNALQETQEPLAFYRSVPHRIEAEQAVLGTMLLNNEAYYRVADFLEPEHFYEPAHRQIYEISRGLIRTSKLASVVILEKLLPADMEIAGLSIGQYLARLAAEARSIGDAEKHGRTVYNLALRRALIVMCEDISRAAYDAPLDLPPPRLIGEAEQRLYELGQTGRYEGGFQKFETALINAVDRAVRAYSRDQRVTGLATGLSDLDIKIGGLQPSDLIILAGRSGMGTTALATNIAYNVAKAWRGEVRTDGTIETIQGGIVGFFSLEMAAEQLATRIIAAQSGISAGTIRRGAISERDFEKIKDVAIELQHLPFFIDETGGLSIGQLAARARRLKRERGLDLIVLDNIQLLESTTRRAYEGGTKGLTEIFRELKALAKELNVPILTLAELPQQIDYRGDKRPRLMDLSESGLIEHADVVLFVFREEYYVSQREPPPETEEHRNWQVEMEAVYGKSEIILAKQRDGPTGTVLLQFNPVVMRFDNLARF